MDDAKDSGRRPATRAEARALAHPLRLRVLRLCLDTALTNRQLAERLHHQPATVLYHVRTLVRNGFLRAEPERRGRRGAREIPYRSTGKSWTLGNWPGSSIHLAAVDAFRAELADTGADSLLEAARLGVRLSPPALERFRRRIGELVEDARAADDPQGDPVSLYIGLHRPR